MHPSAWSPASVARPLMVVLLVVAALAGGSSQPAVMAADPSAPPAASAAPAPTDVPGAMCESASDLRLYVGFLRDQTISEDGLLAVLVGAVASLSEARTLAGLSGETYRPLVDDLIGALQDLGTAVRGFRDQGTVGAGLVQLGESIAAVGSAMDALSAGLREPCPPGSPAASAPPTTAASPAA